MLLVKESYLKTFINNYITCEKKWRDMFKEFLLILVCLHHRNSLIGRKKIFKEKIILIL